jgi:hypothetical protein
MKTGLRFQVPAFNDDTYHSDLFYNQTVNVGLIRGLGKKSSEQAPDMRLAPYGDAFKMMAITEELSAQLTKYYPELVLTDLVFIIDDTKFF